MYKKILLLLSVFAVTLAGCKDDMISSGSSILQDDDEIIVDADTFSVRSALCEANLIYAAPDSFLLGETDSRFGTLHADILTQMACPVGFEYPATSVVDSVCIFLYYRTWFGDGNSPMSISVYEMDRNTFSYNTAYPNNIPLEDYCSLEDSTFILANERIITAAHPTDSVYSSALETYMPYIRFRTTDEFAQRLFAKNNYSSQEAFNRIFKGLYITSTFGSAAVLNIGQISMAVYYHFTYTQSDGKDTTVTDTKTFYANTEVRQINRIQYTNTDFSELEAQSDSINYIISPAHIYTRLSLPMKEMSEDIVTTLGHKRPYVNLAKLRVDILNVYTGSTDDKTTDDWAQPAAQMLLCKESALNRFFADKELPSDTCAILSQLRTGTDTEGNTTYYYSYDIATLLTQQLRQEQYADSLHMVLVPVSVTTSSSSSSSSSSAITRVKPQQTISATVISSAQNATNPMRLEVVYSGF